MATDTPQVPPPNPEEALLRHVVTLGTLIKILAAVGGLLVAIGVYEINQLDKLRDQASTLQATVSSLQVKLDAAEAKLTAVQTNTDKSEDKMAEILKAINEIRGAGTKAENR